MGELEGEVLGEAIRRKDRMLGGKLPRRIDSWWFPVFLKASPGAKNTSLHKLRLIPWQKFSSCLKAADGNVEETK